MHPTYVAQRRKITDTSGYRDQTPFAITYSHNAVQDLQISSMSVLLRFVNQSSLFMCVTEFQTTGFPYACER